MSGVEDNDRNVGAVLEPSWSARMSLGKTAILLSSDHGFFLGEHHLYDKRLMYEPSIRVPMMLRYPGNIKPETTSDEMVLNLDMAPTLLRSGGRAGTRRDAGQEHPAAGGRKAGNRRGARTGSTSITNILDLKMCGRAGACAPSATS